MHRILYPSKDEKEGSKKFLSLSLSLYTIPLLAFLIRICTQLSAFCVYFWTHANHLASGLSLSISYFKSPPCVRSFPLSRKRDPLFLYQSLTPYFIQARICPCLWRRLLELNQNAKEGVWSREREKGRNVFSISHHLNWRLSESSVAVIRL